MIWIRIVADSRQAIEAVLKKLASPVTPYPEHSDEPDGVWHADVIGYDAAGGDAAA